MKVFLCWSGQTSKAVAEALREWLPLIFTNAEPWMSDLDIDPGSRWYFEIAQQLDETHIGIICLTPNNQNASWLLFEAGALSKSLEYARVIPYLFGLPITGVRGPLSAFQATTADKFGTRKLVNAINRARPPTERPLSDELINRMFDKWWDELEKELAKIPFDTNTSEEDSVQENSSALAKLNRPFIPQSEIHIDEKARNRILR